MPSGVRRACDEAAQGEVVSPANINSPDQVVIAGAAAAVQRASERAKALGAKRAVPLPVSAPFHCALMKPAEERLAARAAGARGRRPAGADRRQRRCPAEAGCGRPPSTRWCVRCRPRCCGRRSSQCLASAGVTTYVEVGPGRVLGGLVKKVHKEAQVFAFAEPADLEAILRSGQ